LYNDSFIQVQAYKNTVKTSELQKDWYHKTQLALEEKVWILSANLENTTNTLKYSETLYDQAKIEKKEWEVKLVESLARFDKWKKSSKNLAKLINSSMSTRTKLGLGFKEYIRSDEVFDLSTPSVFDPKPENIEVKSLYERFVKAGEMHEVQPPITGTFMPTSYKSDLEETQDCDVYDNIDNFPSVVLKAASVPVGSRNSSASISAGRSIPAASRNRPASIHAGRHIPASRFNKLAPFPAGRSVPIGWTNHVARPFFRPTNLYFDNVSW
nr:ribonuclease H-like domain, reverse transcriptase, RNA-dependent DNA polymerase [Tanacetum cinerariifolium]